ncbi:PAAR domain-containing protein [Alkalimonas collagenimarina]|uniref:PAAR domain-containing protein n=1 Tax=Alkalimonas collagenimarina TaxID=400390 RepID=A0ABT9GYT4_9GAMM|nr:PAAR domain-containing protein [Alkalimonas collagenimarina]MDP4536223.1 PAAR domain-containing protein [Alkalimonas collagenimarina]
MSKPAARIGDMHVCPKVTSKVPHVGGPIVQGSPNVFIGGMPAAKVGDKLVCVGPPDSIKTGSKSVSINGKAAARLGDSTDHGGKIVMGNPTVLIGDKAYKGPNAAKLPEGPKTTEEAMKRLDEAGKKVAAAKANNQPPPSSPYSSEDKLYVVAGGLDEKFIVRVIETKYAGDNGSIGYVPQGANTATYWTTTFTQLEHADSDPELLTSAVGITYDPDASYTLLLIDQEKANAGGDMVSFIPTYDNLAEFAATELADEFVDQEELIAPVMTEEYSHHYERVYQSAEVKGINLNDEKQFNELAKDLGFDEDEINLLEVRHKLKNSTGANEQFLGNGMTKDNTMQYEETPYGTASPDKHYGPVETYTYDKNPQTLLKLEQAGIVTRIPLSAKG